MIDSQTLENLRMLNDGTTNLLVELIKMYCSAAPDRLSKMQSALDDKNLKSLGEIAHSLKSSSGNLGAMSVHKMCQELETNAHKNTQGFDFQTSLNNLKAEIDLAMKALTEEMNKEIAADNANKAAA